MTEIAVRLAVTALTDKPLYGDQTLGDGVDGQEETFKSHSSEQSGAIGGYEALSSDFVTVQGQSRFSHGPNVALAAGDYNPLRPSRFQLKPFRQRSGYYGERSAGVYEQLNVFGTPRRASQVAFYVEQSHINSIFTSKGIVTQPTIKATTVTGLLKGAKREDLPVEAPTISS